MKRALTIAILALGLAACRSTPSSPKTNDVRIDPTKGGTGIAPPPCSDDAGEVATEDEAYGRKVLVICIEGVRADATKTVEKALGFETGAVLTEKGLRDGLEAIHRTHIANDVSAYARKLGPGIALKLAIQERPRVGKVSVEGASAVNIEVEKAPEPTPLHQGQHFDPVYAAERARALRDAYVSAGWEEATVTPETKPAGDGIVDVRMVIHEGTRSRVGKITMKGVTPALEKGLLDATKLVTNDPLDPEVLSVAPLRMSAYYYESGHITANPRIDRGARGADGTVPLMIEVTEGPVFHVGKLRVTKSDLDAAGEQRLVSSLQTKSGAVFRRAMLVTDIDSVKHAFADRGRTVEVTPITNVNQAKQTIDVDLEIGTP